MEWLPIESAPKDGTFILLGGGEWGDEDVEDAPRVMVARWYEYERSSGYFKCWLVTVAEGGCSLFPYANPTHWMPLPAPPEEKP